MVYNAVDWPGISTSVTTVMVTGLSTTAAMKQRFTLRILGSLLGGLILGRNHRISLSFHGLDYLVIVLVGTLTFVASWIAGGPLFNYLGLQVAFSFYLVAWTLARPPSWRQPAIDSSGYYSRLSLCDSYSIRSGPCAPSPPCVEY
jgi:multidrug resistance protein MdtO